MTLTLPGLDIGAPVWQRRTRGDAAARALADRHYTKRVRGARRIGPPGRVLILVTPCERAVWLSHWPRADLALDRLDAWRCSMFPNEGAGLSSDLIRAAMDVTAEIWGDMPADGWLTWIDTSKVAGVHPGYCFKRAGWELDREWTAGAHAPNLIRLRAR